MSGRNYNALPALAAMYQYHKTVPAHGVVSTMFAFLDSMPHGIDTDGLVHATGMGVNGTTMTRAAFTHFGYATMLPYLDSGEHGRDRPAYALFTATDHLAPIAKGYNETVVDAIIERMPGNATAEAITDLAIRQYAVAHRIDHRLLASEIIGIVRETSPPDQRPPHPQTVQYRALGSFAFAQGVWLPVERDLHALIKDPELPPLHQPPLPA